MSATVLLGGIGEVPLPPGARAGDRGTGATGFAGAVRDAVAERERRDAGADAHDGTGSTTTGRAEGAVLADASAGATPQDVMPQGTASAGLRGGSEGTASAGLPGGPAGSAVPAPAPEHPTRGEAIPGVAAGAEDIPTGSTGDAAGALTQPLADAASAPTAGPDGVPTAEPSPVTPPAAAAIPGAVPPPVEPVQGSDASGEAALPAAIAPAAGSGARTTPPTAGAADAAAAGRPAGAAAPATAPSPAIAAPAVSGVRLTGSVAADAPAATAQTPARAEDVPEVAATAAPAATRPAAAGAPAPPAAPVIRPALLPQVNSPLIALARSAEGEHSLTLTVSPESLGPVTVRAHIVAGTIRLELQAPSDVGREALKAILTELRRDLAAAAPGASVTVSNQQTPAGADARPDPGGRFAHGGADDQGGGGRHRDAAPAHPRASGGPGDPERIPYTAPRSPDLPTRHGIDVYA